MKTFRNNTMIYCIGLLILALPLIFSCEEGYNPEKIDVTVRIEGIVIDLKDSSPVSDVKVTFLEKSGFWTPKKTILTTAYTNETGKYSANFTLMKTVSKGYCHSSTILFEAMKEGYGGSGTTLLGRYCEFNCNENVQFCELDTIKVMKLFK